MAAEKKTTKTTVKKAAVKKTPAPKKAPAKKAAAKPVAPVKPVISSERFYAMVSEAAYFAAQNDGNRKGAVEYWLEAEAGVRTKFDVA